MRVLPAEGAEMANRWRTVLPGRSRHALRVAGDKGVDVTDQIIELLKRQAGERIDVNGSTITQQLIESEKQELPVSITFKLKRSGNKLIATSKCVFAKKFSDDGIESIDWDDDQRLIEFKKTK